MSLRGRFRFAALVLSFAPVAGLSACNGDDAGGGGDDEAEAGDTAVGGATTTGGGAGRGGGSPSGGTTRGGSSSGGTSSGGTSTGGSSTGGRGGSGSGVTGGSGNAAGNGGGLATGGTASNAGRAGSAGMMEPPAGGNGSSPYEIECHGDTAMCGAPTALLCLGLRIGTDVLGYSCANECQSDAECSDRPSSTDAAAGCVDFVNKKYCLLVCKNGDEEASCPTGMYCYSYEGTTTGYCLWH